MGVDDAAGAKKTSRKPIKVDGEIAYIPLSKGLFAVVDVADLHIVESINWYAKVKNGATTYAARWRPVGASRSDETLMHRMIAGTPKHMDTDHIDGNGLNNRRSNLRSATKSQNMHNARVRKDNSSGYKGVNWNKRKAKWEARIRLNGKHHRLGYHATPEAAHKAYCAASKALHGEFSRVL